MKSLPHHTTNPRAARLPNRPLRSDFTAQTMRHAATAKRRNRVRERWLGIAVGAPANRRRIRVLPAALLTFGVVAAGSVGAYALANWFGGNITVKQSASILHVDLSQCKGLPVAGVESPGRDVQFKIVRRPAISAHDLQQRLLAECESEAVVQFFTKHVPETFASRTVAPFYHYGEGTITSLSAQKVTIVYPDPLSFTARKTVTFTIAPDATIFSLGQSAQLSDLAVGSHIAFVARNNTQFLETQDPLAAPDTSVISIFRTQYDLTQAPGKTFYGQSNIEPLSTRVK